MGTQGPIFQKPPFQPHQKPAKKKFWQDRRTLEIGSTLILLIAILLAYATGLLKADEDCLPSEVREWVNATNQITEQSSHVDEIFTTPGEMPMLSFYRPEQDKGQIAAEFEAAYRSQLELEPPPCLAPIHQYTLDIYLYHWGYFHTENEDEIEANYQLASEAVDLFNQERLRLIEEGILDR